MSLALLAAGDLWMRADREPATMTILYYLLLGAITGVLAGMLGIGGGLVVVPVLALLFARAGVDAAVLMHLAIGSSLATIVVTSLSSAYAHHRHRAVLWPVFARLAPGIILGAGLGSALAGLFSARVLRDIVAGFEFLAAAQLALGFGPAPHRSLPGTLGTGVAGVVIGSVSTIIGISGGSLTVPFLVWANVDIRRAVGTSAACGLPIALAGTLGYIVAGWGAAALPPGSSGYIYWPAVAGVAVGTLLFAPLGARLTHALPTAVLRRTFAVFLAGLGVYMLMH